MSNSAAEKVHSILSPSGAKRWGNCVAALAACKNIAESKDTSAADLGSAKHQTVEWILRNPETAMTALKAEELATFNGRKFPVDEEYTEHVNVALAHIRSLGGDQLWERWVSTEPLFGVQDQGGTADVIALHAYDGYIDLLDMKFGWTPIAPDGPQNKIYAAAILEELDPYRLTYTKARLHISQPKRSDQLQTVEISRDELDAFIAKLKPAAQTAYKLYHEAYSDELDEFKTPSDEACEWCPIRLTCTPRLQQLAADFPIVPAAPVGKPITYDPVQMSNEELDAALTRVDSVVKFVADWAAGIRAEGLRRAQAGNFPGWMEVEGKKGARVVPPADKSTFEMIVIADLGDEAYEPRVVKSPTQLEKTYKKLGRLDEWRNLQDGPADAEGVRRGGFVVQGKGQPSLARTTAGIAPIGHNIAGEFGLVEAQI